MADIKTFTQEVIPDVAFPVEDSVISEKETIGGTAQVVKPTEISEQSMPTPRVAVELISTQLNTRTAKILAEFGFTPSGAIQIGKYENGVSGDIRISPNGILGRDLSGNTTFAIDADTGNATFAGEVRTGSSVTGLLTVGDSAVVIDGINRRQVWFDPDTGDPVIGIGFL